MSIITGARVVFNPQSKDPFLQQQEGVSFIFMSCILLQCWVFILNIDDVSNYEVAICTCILLISAQDAPPFHRLNLFFAREQTIRRRFAYRKEEGC